MALEDRKAWLTFRDLTRDTKLKTITEMNERMHEACQKPVQHLRVFFTLFSCALHVLCSGGR